MDEQIDDQTLKQAQELTPEQKEQLAEEQRQFDEFMKWAEVRLKEQDCCVLTELLIMNFRVYYLIRQDLMQIMAERMPPSANQVFILEWTNFIRDRALQAFSVSDLRKSLNSMLRRYINGKVHMERLGEAQAARAEKVAERRSKARRKHKEMLDGNARRAKAGREAGEQPGTRGDPSGDGRDLQPGDDQDGGGEPPIGGESGDPTGS